MDQIGRVIGVDGKEAVVEVERNSACAKCGICHMGESQSMRLVVDNSFGAQVGSRVLIEMEKTTVLKAGFIIYLIPLLALLAGIGIMYGVNSFYELPGSPDWWGIGVGLGLFALSFIAIRLMEPVFKRNPDYIPAIVRVVEDFEEITDICGHKDNE